MSRKYASQLALEINPSAIYRILVVCVGVLSLIGIILILDDYPLYGLISFLFLFIYLTAVWAQNRAMLLQCMQDGSWQLQCAGVTSILELSSKSVITPVLSILKFKTRSGKAFHVPLFMDSVDNESYRRLRVKIKVEGIKPVTHDKIM